MLIALDVMGGDRAPVETLHGAVLARQQLGIQVVLVGPRSIIEEELAHSAGLPDGLQVVEANEAVAMDDAPAAAVRHRKDASINVAMGLVKRGIASAVVSAGNTGAVMASALLNLGRIEGLERPAIGTMVPYGDPGVLILDIGANADCRPTYLLQFAQMGSVYLEKVYGIPRPRVGLLNIGEEEGKGNELAVQVYPKLKESGLNFVGNIEGRDLHRGLVDVVVTDGFTGNVAVKVGEGVADFLHSVLFEAVTSRPHYSLAALLLKPALKKVKARFDHNERGGAPLLGVNGVVIIAHGRSDANGIKNALRIAHEGAVTGMADAIRNALMHQ
jgi:glycerol-3-phosphate acyltransferase PlsX